jgi:hypothetical protein
LRVFCVHGLGLAREDAGDLEGRRDAAKDLVAQLLSGVRSRVYFIPGLEALLSRSDQSSSFLCRKYSGRSNIRLLMVVSMVKTLSTLLVTLPMRSTTVLSSLAFGSMYEWHLRITFGLWCALRLS